MGSDNQIRRLGELRGGSHLADDQLVESYVLADENSHIAGCRQCQARYDELVRALHHVREDANREADQVFTSERLHEQRDRILRRIERHDHPGEIVAFPNRTASHPAVQRVLGPARRWIAGAAAAGRAAGMFLGFTMDRRMHETTVTQTTARPASTTAVVWQAAEERDSDFFIEIDDALLGSRTVELRAIDAMTTPVEIREASYPR
jgi:hypothetical protein